VYPGAAPLGVLRNNGYANISDNDPWNHGYQFAAILTDGGAPGQTDDVYIFSKGAGGSGSYTPPYTGAPLASSHEVGYSSVYGSFSGS
jgi:hypothetical protein